MSFAARRLSVSFAYANGTSKTVSELRISARIAIPGGQDKATAEIAIFGMSLSDMNALTVLPTQVNSVGDNHVTVLAGDEGGATTTVFYGDVRAAFVDAASMPNVAFRISAIPALNAEMKPAAANSYPNQIDVATVMQTLAQQIGAGFENNSVSIKLKYRYFWGSAMAQIRTLAKEAGIEFVVEKNVLAIWMPGKTRSGDAITISPETGMVGYPVFSAQGIRVTTLFVPSLNYGSQITVQSSLTPACGSWAVYFVSHALDAMTPNGSWFTTIDASRIEAQSDD